MGNLEILSLKVKKTAEKLKKLNDENLRLKAEINFLRKENENNRKKIGEYAVLKENAAVAVTKIERILKKIDTVKV
jgi:molecular chaperone GrpE (heat shock protein)